MKSPTAHHRSTSVTLRVALILAALTPNLLLAQVSSPEKSSAPTATTSVKPTTTAAVESPTNATSNAVVELSPFTVNAAEDTGWRAQNTLAGSRMNSSLADTPGVLDVLTKEFLDDMGVTSLDQALAFSANFEDNSAGDQGVNSAYPGANQGMNFNVRGQSGVLARNFLATSFRPEFYTIERIDNSSGPNAILFGIGSAGGVANVSSKRAKLSRFETSIDFRVDNYRSLRATVDTNLVMIPKKLALRVNAIDSRGQGYRKYSDNDLSGTQLALKFRPFENTEINVEYELDHSTGLVVDPRTTDERITTWIAAGSQTVVVPTNWDTITAAARTTLLTSYSPQGIDNSGTADQPVYVAGNQPYMINTKNALRSTGTNLQLTNNALLPYTMNVSGPGGLKEINRHLLAVSIDQKLAKSLYANISLSREGGDAVTYQSFHGTGGGATALTADPNATLNNTSALANLSGRTFATNTAGQIINPHAGEWYLDGRWRRRTQDSRRDSVQASLAWGFDAGKWLGSHNLVTNFAYSEYSTPSASYDEMWVNAPFNNNPTATANAVIRRSYLAGGNLADFTNVPWMQTQSLTWNHPTKGVQTTGWVINGPARNDYRDRSALIAAQSAFFKRHLITTVGVRKDEQNSYQFLPHVIKPPGYETSNGLSVIDAASVVDKTTLSGATKTLGAVLHITNWVSVYGNKSNAISPIAAWKFGPDGLRGPNQQGEGLDGGLKFKLFDEKLSLDLGYYDTATVGASGRFNLSVKTDGTVPWAWDAIFETLDHPDGAAQVLNINDAAAVNAVIAKYRAIRPIWLSDADVGDRASRGYEARLMANPFKGLRLRATFSITNVRKENQMIYSQEAFLELKNYLAELKTTHPTVGSLTNVAGKTLLTIDQNVAAIDQYIQEAIAADSSGYESSKYRGNFNASYDLPGRFKGWTTGFGTRYQSGRVVANYQIVNPAKPNLILNTIPVFGASQTTWSALLRYTTRNQIFGRKTKLSFQLNVENLMNKNGTEIRRYSTYKIAPGAAIPPLGPPTYIWVVNPRSWSLTTRIDF
jgi:iron complex outermembrane receptor protein